MHKRSIIDRLTGIISLHHLSSDYSQNIQMSELIDTETVAVLDMLSEDKEITDSINFIVKDILGKSKTQLKFDISKEGFVEITISLPKSKSQLSEKDIDKCNDMIVKKVHSIINLKKSHIKVIIIPKT